MVTFSQKIFTMCVFQVDINEDDKQEADLGDGDDDEEGSLEFEYQEEQEVHTNPASVVLLYTGGSMLTVSVRKVQIFWGGGGGGLCGAAKRVDWTLFIFW